MSRYFTSLFFTILAFMGLVLLVFNTDQKLFIGQLYLCFMLLIVAGTALYAARAQVRVGWLLLGLFFAIVLFDSIYLYTRTLAGMAILFCTLLVSAIGFIISIGGIERRQKRYSRVIIDDFEDLGVIEEPFEEQQIVDEKPAAAMTPKPAKKTVARKKTRKKTAKATKKTTKKASKKTTGKSTKKAAKKTPKRVKKKPTTSRKKAKKPATRAA